MSKSTPYSKVQVSNARTLISKTKTADDWKTLSLQLRSANAQVNWGAICKDYFIDRLNPRYLKPIKDLQTSGGANGVGFSILAIQCSLIEFLESTAQGINYVYPVPKGGIGQHEYSVSSKVFSDFLTTRQPFRGSFTLDLAKQFYKHIRCPVLHEARTTGGWRVYKRDPIGLILDHQKQIIFRDNFQDALSEYISWYRQELPLNVQLQQAFIRKYDALSRP